MLMKAYYKRYKKGGEFMIDLLKNKTLICFMLLVLIAVYFDAVNTKRLEESKANDNIQQQEDF